MSLLANHLGLLQPQSSVQYSMACTYKAAVWPAASTCGRIASSNFLLRVCASLCVAQAACMSGY